MNTVINFQGVSNVLSVFFVYIFGGCFFGTLLTCVGKGCVEY